ncbi:hypothetical protein D6829_02245 [Candidatus Pacearchaeota archaeon]|nr:MAG: hypothetical protein D6829_02245 [Candidatus Pacearchaeota archaeon]
MQLGGIFAKFVSRNKASPRLRLPELEFNKAGCWAGRGTEWMAEVLEVFGEIFKAELLFLLA